MSVLTRNAWIRHVCAVLVAVVTIGAMTAPATPAQARVWVGLDTGVPVGWGYYAPGYYYHPGPRYYPGWRWRHPGWRWRHHWCYYHPYRCGW